MSTRSLLLVMLGYSVGHLPDDNIAGDVARLVFLLVLLVMYVRTLRSSRRRPGRGAA
jgi:hypothetical protein